METFFSYNSKHLRLHNLLARGTDLERKVFYNRLQYSWWFQTARIHKGERKDRASHRHHSHRWWKLIFTKFNKFSRYFSYKNPPKEINSKINPKSFIFCQRLCGSWTENWSLFAKCFIVLQSLNILLQFNSFASWPRFNRLLVIKYTNANCYLCAEIFTFIWKLLPLYKFDLLLQCNHSIENSSGWTCSMLWLLTIQKQNTILKYWMIIFLLKLNSVKINIILVLDCTWNIKGLKYQLVIIFTHNSFKIQLYFKNLFVKFCCDGLKNILIWGYTTHIWYEESIFHITENFLNLDETIDYSKQIEKKLYCIAQFGVEFFRSRVAP